mgnify:CR=1 FL=1
MDLIDKWWKRFLVSLFAAAALTEVISLMTDRIIELNALIITFVLYLILSIVYGLFQNK